MDIAEIQPAAAVRREVDVADVLGALKRQRAIVFGAPLALVIVAGLYAAVARPAYTATAQVYVDPRERHAPKDDPLQDAVPGDGLLLVESQLKIITSDEVLMRVVEKVHLDGDPEFNGDGGGVIRKILTAIRLAEPVDPKLAALRNLRLKTATKRIDRSFVIDILASADTPDRAVRITNALAASYLEGQSKADAQYSRRLSESVNAQLEKLRLAVTQSENAVATFRAENNLVGSRSRLVTEQQLDEANTQFTNARTRLAQAQAHVRLIDSIRKGKAGLETLPEAIQSVTITQMRARATDLAREEAMLSSLDGPLHPALRAVQAQRRELQAAIKTEVQRIAQSVQNAAANESANVQNLQSSFDALKAQAQTNDRLLVPLRQLERTAEANREIYANFLAKAKTAEQQQVIDKSNIRLITTATPPETRSWPPTVLMLATALLVGLLLGVAIALARDYLASRREDSDAAPPDGSDREAQLRQLTEDISLEPIGYTALFLRISPESSFDFAPLEIARDLQQEGGEVLFIDADLTGRRTTRLLRLEKRRGLADALYDNADFEDAARFHERLGFTIMPAGLADASVADEEAPRALAAVLEAAREFDHVVIDAGPVETFWGGLPLHELVDEVVIVAASSADKTKVEEALALFETEGVAIRALYLREQREAA